LSDDLMNLGFPFHQLYIWKSDNLANQLIHAEPTIFI